MKTFMPNSKSLGNCSTLMVFPPTCLINLFATSSTISSNPKHLSSQFPRKSSIFAFLSPVHIPFRFALKSHVCFVFRSSTRLSSFFPFKDKVPKFLRSGVVYLFKCRCCSASYVGQTTHHLHTRVSEHLGISHLHPIHLCPAYFPTLKPQVILPALMTFKSTFLVQTIVK